MSALNRLGPTDLERLSAYVDGDLAPRERSALEARLETEATLRQALAELHSVKASLTGLPELRPPRNFTLREADIRRATVRPGYPALRFATVMATALFVLTTAVRSLSATAMPMAFSSAPLAAAEVQSEAGAAIAPTEPSLQLRAEAPAAAPEEGAADSLMAAATPTASGTPCPECPTSLTAGKNHLGEEGGALSAEASREGSAIPPLAAVQWLLGLAAVGLALLTLRARRR